MAQLSHLLNRFSAQVFFNGEFCGENGFSKEDQRGHLHLVRQGMIRFRFDDQSSLYVKGPALVFFPRNINYRLCVTSPSPALLLCANITFDGGPQNALCKALPESFVHKLGEFPSASSTLELLFNEAGQTHYGQQAMLNRLAEILTIQVIRHIFDNGHMPAGILSGLADAGLSRALGVIHEQPAFPWSLEKLAEVAGMSRSKFAKRFHEIVGTTPAEYLTDLRMGMAQALLRRQKLVKTVALEVGYQSQPAFTKAFTAKFGVSPRSWLEALPA